MPSEVQSLIMQMDYAWMTILVITCLFIQQVKKNRDPRWDEEFTFMLEEPPVKDRMHVEVLSTSSRIGLLHPKVISCEPLLADIQLF